MQASGGGGKSTGVSVTVEGRSLTRHRRGRAVWSSSGESKGMFKVWTDGEDVNWEEVVGLLELPELTPGLEESDARAHWHSHL